jgi:hypothetical protein
MDNIIALKPKSILDIGTEFGKYGVLCREYLELWDGRQKYEFTRRIIRPRQVVATNYIIKIYTHFGKYTKKSQSSKRCI